MNSISDFLKQLELVARIVSGQAPEAQEAAYKIALSDTDPKLMFAICMTHPDEFVPLMNAFVREKVQTHMDATIRREQDRAADPLATVEKKSEDTTSTSPSASPIEDMIAEYNKTYAGMSWADIDEAETAREAAESKAAATPVQPTATPVQPTDSWAHRISAFPALPTPGTTAAPKAAIKTVAMPAAKSTKASTPVRATNWKKEKAKTTTSEDWLFGLGIHDEKDDWFLRKADEHGMPIGWRRDRAGWLTSRKNALFRHKLNNQGTDWIHQTYDESIGKWVSKSYDAYKLAMQRARTQR